MKDKTYYSIRTGKNSKGLKLDFVALSKLFLVVYREFERKYYFQEFLGYQCIDEGKVPGIAGEDEEAYIFLKLRKNNIWPIEHYLDIILKMIYLTSLNFYLTIFLNHLKVDFILGETVDTIMILSIKKLHSKNS